MKIPLSLRLTLTIAFIIFLLVIFFIGYNNFLLDKSLAALDVSLRTLRTGETLGVALLLNIDSVSELVKDDFDESRLAKLVYLDSTILERAASRDVQIILSNLINEKVEAKPNFLKALDISTLTFKRGISNTFALARRGNEPQLKEGLKAAIDSD
ncbi:MAG: hypothetical protein JSW18_02890 [Candidatus Omnitrophota bacterium]|nr:MAG: hypothetical protein JSW18_02890 [Candidatus Omnitrophota bacterium]